jgi:hypothetical protein
LKIEEGAISQGKCVALWKLENVGKLILIQSLQKETHSTSLLLTSEIRFDHQVFRIGR